MTAEMVPHASPDVATKLNGHLSDEDNDQETLHPSSSRSSITDFNLGESFDRADYVDTEVLNEHAYAIPDNVHFVKVLCVSVCM